MTLAGSGIATVEKFPLFCATKLVKLAPPLCAGVILTNASDAAPGTGPVPMMGVRLGLLDWSVTVVGLPPFVVKLEASNPPAAPFALRRPFVIVTVRMGVFPGVPSGSVEMMIVPLKPFSMPPLTGAVLVKAGLKVSKASALRPEEFPICVIVIGIEVGLVIGCDTPTVVNVVVPPETVATTWSVLTCWPNVRMVAALADVDIASDATHTAANRVNVERMVLLLPL